MLQAIPRISARALIYLASFLTCQITSSSRAQEINRLLPSASLSIAQAEVSPGRFLIYLTYSNSWHFEDKSFRAIHTLESEPSKFFQKYTTYLSIPWQDGEIFWVGVGIPICLREHAGHLYLITFDRETDFNKIRFRYYEQNDDSLVEIPPDKFPKPVATQNLWLREENGFRDGKPINAVVIAKNLDPADGDFRDSLTAKIWLQLETGKQYYQMRQEIDEAFLKKYLAERQVVKLTEITKEIDADSAIELCSKHLRAEPHDATYYGLRAKQYYRKGDFDSSLSDLTEVLRLDPSNARAYYYRSLVYRQKGEDAKAKDDELQAKKLGASGEGRP